MKRLLIMLLAATIALLGCGLTEKVIVTAVPSPTAWAQPTQPPLPTPLPLATVTSASTPVPTVVVVNPPVPVANCVPRGDWPFYLVVSGDTLAGIAARTGSSVSALTTANCLSNANTIFVGQQLRVPRQPAPPTPYPVPTSMDSLPRILSFRLATEAYPPRLEWVTWNASAVMLSVTGPRGAYIGYGAQMPSGTFAVPALGFDFTPRATFTLTMKDSFGRDVIGPNGQIVMAQVDIATEDAPLACPPVNESGVGNILVSPVMGMSGRCSTVNANTTLWINWEGVFGLTSVVYYFAPTTDSICGAAGEPNVIGVDENLMDGNTITWNTGFGPCTGVLYALGYSDNKAIESRQHPLVIYHR